MKDSACLSDADRSEPQPEILYNGQKLARVIQQMADGAPETVCSIRLHTSLDLHTTVESLSRTPSSILLPLAAEGRFELV